MFCSLMLLASVGFAIDAPKPIDVTILKRTTPISYTREISDLLDAKCVGCHSAALAENKLILENVPAMFKGGKHGPAIIAGNADNSLLFTMSAHRVDPVMPPKDKKDLVALSSEELGLLKQWIDAGAVDDSETNLTPAKTIEIGSLPPNVHPINAVDLTSDGRRVAAGRGNVVQVYDVNSGVEVRRLGGHKDIIQSIRFSPDAKKLAVGSYQIVTLWNAPTATLDKTFVGSPEPIKATAMFRDGKSLVTASAEKTLRFWNMADGKTFRSVNLPTGVEVLALSTDEKQLATGTIEGEIRLLNIRDGEVQATLLNAHASAITSIHYLPDGKALVSTGVDGVVRVWSLAVKPGVTPTARTVLEGAKSPIRVSTLTVDGKSLIIASDDPLVREIDLTDGKGRLVIAGSTGRVMALAISPNGKTLLVGSSDKSARLYDHASGRLLSTFGPHTGPVIDVSFTPQGDKVITSGSDGAAKIWDVATGQGVITFSHDSVKPGESAPTICKSIAFAKGRIATIADKVIRTWSYEGVWSEGKTLAPHAFRVLALDFSPDGKLVATGGGEPSRGGEVKIWNVTTGELIRSLETIHSDTVFAIRFSPDGTKLATASADKFLKVINVADGKELRSFEGHTHHVLAVDWRSDNRQLVTGGADNVIKVWDLETGESVRSLNPATKSVTGLRWIPGRPTVIGSTGEPSVCLWNTDTGAITRTFEGVSDYLFAISASADGGRIASGGADGILLLWNMANGPPIQKLFPPISGTKK